MENTWELRILVTDLQLERAVRVNGGDHVGGVMIKLVDVLDIAMDWSDHALWWPGSNKWLSKTRWTLEQYNITADHSLEFTPMHKILRVQLPDLRYTDCRVDFSINSFSAMVNLCQELEIRHPEELSFCKGVESEHLKFNYGTVRQHEEKHRRITVATMPLSPRPDTNTYISNSETLRRKSTNSSPLHRKISNRSQLSIGTPRLVNKSFGSDWSLAMSPPPTMEAKETIVRPKSLVEKARMNVSWLDSSLSLMEQGVHEFDTLQLRYKYYSFYDLNPKEDPVRINLIYEQAKWQILNEEVDCTEEEQYLFSALQLQVGLQANVPQPLDDPEDDIDTALNNLQLSLDGGQPSHSSDMTSDRQLNAYLKFLKPKRFTLKGWKTSYFVFRDLHILGWKSSEECKHFPNQPHISIQVKGCEVVPDVNIHQQKFGIKLSIPRSDGMSDLWLKCEGEDQYSQWMAACRVASRGKKLSDCSYDQELSSIKAFLSMQHPASLPAINPNTLDIDVSDYVAHRFIKKRGRTKCRTKILEAHANVKDLNLIESKMNFIKAWQSLPEYGNSLFVVKFHGERKEELLGISANRVSRMNISGEHVTSWRYNTIKAWNVNWETGYMMIQLGTGPNIIFQCLSADCKVVHEFIGGYIFMSMRSKESNQALNKDLFHKLTAGWN